jgi:SAM-dependent MidA family methyltransferase
MDEPHRARARARSLWRTLAVHLIENSPALRHVQADRLAKAAPRAAWRNELREVPPGPILLVANEFFDALPVRQFVRVDGAWRERVIGLQEDGRLAFGLGPSRLVDGPPACDGAVIETRPAAEALIAEIAERLVAHGGAALVIDFGYADGISRETLQGVRRHSFADILAQPGATDLAAHVDFGALARNAARAGASVHGPIEQREFLLALGLNERATRLSENADAAHRKDIAAAVERLAGADQMGSLFKVLAIAQPGVGLPPFGTQGRQAAPPPYLSLK